MVDDSSKHFTSILDNIWLGIGNMLMIQILRTFWNNLDLLLC